jgi:CubicO group peptidase (beta-lactamase class C family)
MTKKHEALRGMNTQSSTRTVFLLPLGISVFLCGIFLCSVFLITQEGGERNASLQQQGLLTFNRDTIRKIDGAAAQLMQKNQIPGVAIGVIRRNQVVYSKGFGIANVDTQARVTPQTVFHLGSESKMMVGTSIMQLQKQGKINLDAPLTEYLPYFHLSDVRYKKITIRQVLSHRSGLPYCIDYKACDYLDYQSPQYDDKALERHVRDVSTVALVAEPGVKMQYSDIGFEMLGDVIAKLSGQSFEAYVKDHIFLPLGMQHSSFLLKDIPPQSLAAPHVLKPNLKVNSYFPYSRQHAPSSHLFSSVEDMSRFALAQLNHGQWKTQQLLPASAYAAMWAPEIPTSLPSPWEKELGLGWFLGETLGHRLVGHAGGDTGFAAEFVMAPADGVAVIVMVNREFMVEDFAIQIMHWLLAPVQPAQ